MLTVIHAADFHLDSAFSGLTEEQAKQRRRESRQLPARLAALATAQKADLVLLAGDLFDGATVYRQTVEQLAAALAECPCPVLIAPGNHDWYGPRSPWATVSWPEQVHLFTSSAVERVAFPQLGCVVYGAAFTAPAQEQSLLEGFCAEDEGLLRLMVLHGEVTAGSSPYGPVTTRQIAQSGLDYLALGHVHACSGLQRAGETWWAYPGCPEGRGFDELGEKGVLVTRLEGNSAQCDFVPLARRRYHLLRVELTGRDPLTAIRLALPDTAAMDICRIVLEGEADPPDLDALAQRLADDCWQLQLRDGTRLGEDVWRRAGEDSLRGLLLTELKSRAESAAHEDDRRLAQTAARFALAALDGREI